MADNTENRDDTFDEFLNRAEDDLESSDDETPEEEGIGGASLSGAIVIRRIMEVSPAIRCSACQSGSVKYCFS